jgi:hypothetical protein
MPKWPFQAYDEFARRFMTKMRGSTPAFWRGSEAPWGFRSQDPDHLSSSDFAQGGIVDYFLSANGYAKIPPWRATSSLRFGAAYVWSVLDASWPRAGLSEKH